MSEIITDSKNKSYAIGINFSIADIETKIKNAIELQTHRPIVIKHNHYVSKTHTDNTIKSIDEYTRQHKSFLLSDFTEKDIMQISTMSEGYFIVNQCRIPVLNGNLLLNQWITRYAKIDRVKMTVEQIKQSRKDSQKRYVQKQKDIAEGLIEKEDTNTEITFTSMTSIFRDYARAKSTMVKRIITAKRISEISQYIPDMFFEDCLYRPIVKKTFYKNIIDMCTLPFEHEMSNRVFVKTQDVYNKHYIPEMLTLRTNYGQIYQYTEKGLIPIQ